MTSERLRALVERAEQLPPEQLDRLILEIEDILDEAEWHALLADPRSGPVLDELIAEAKQSPSLPWPTAGDMGDEE